MKLRIDGMIPSLKLLDDRGGSWWEADSYVDIIAYIQDQRKERIKAVQLVQARMEELDRKMEQERGALRELHTELDAFAELVADIDRALDSGL